MNYRRAIWPCPHFLSRPRGLQRLQCSFLSLVWAGCVSAVAHVIHSSWILLSAPHHPGSFALSALTGVVVGLRAERLGVVMPRPQSSCLLILSRTITVLLSKAQEMRFEVTSWPKLGASANGRSGVPSSAASARERFLRCAAAPAAVPDLQRWPE